MNKIENYSSLLTSIKEIVNNAQVKVYKNTNSVLLDMYWQVGKLIVESEQKGKIKAEYGKAVLKKLAQSLTLEFGKGFDESNLRNIRQFYIAFPIRDSVRHELSWTHYRIISRIDDHSLRTQYIQYCIDENWNTRTLQRNIDSKYIGRILELKKKNEPKITPKHVIKDPYILEFLGLNNQYPNSENKIETAIINHLQQFLMEMGKGFAFVARQQHIITDTSDFFIDLVFYNYHLKCFVLIDLKTRKLTHSDIGQMDMYVRMYNDLKKGKDDNPTIGIILCTEKDEIIIKYSVLAENEKLFASKYRLYLPKEDELRLLIESDRIKLNLENKSPKTK